MNAPQPGRFLTPALLPALLIVSYVSALCLGLAEGETVSTSALEHRVSRLSGPQSAGLIVLMVGASLFLTHYAPVLTRLAEGDRWSGRAARWLRARKRYYRERERRRLLHLHVTAAHDPEVLVEARRLAASLSERYPMNDAMLRPTALGNALAASHERVEQAYGLDVPLAWPRLYQVLGRRVRTEADTRRGLLDMYVSFCVYGMVAAAASVVAWPRGNVAAMLAWLAPLVVVGLSYPSAVRAAVAYASTLRVAFDLHRFDLYDALHLPTPSDQSEERIVNRALSAQWGYGVVTGAAEPPGERRDAAEDRHEVTGSGVNVQQNVVQHHGGTFARRLSSKAARVVPGTGTAGVVFQSRDVHGTPPQSPPVAVDPPGASPEPWDDDRPTPPVTAEDTDEHEDTDDKRIPMAGAVVGGLAALAAAAPVSGTLAMTAVGVAAVSGALALSEAVRRRNEHGRTPEASPPKPPPALGYAYRPAQASSVVQVGGDAIREALTPSAPIAFRGGIAVAVDQAHGVRDVDGEPQWRLRSGQEATLVVVLGLGAEHQREPRALLGRRDGIAEELLVVAGRSAHSVELDVVVDAPFMKVDPARRTLLAPVDDTRLELRSVISASEPGTYDVRVAVYAAGRLVQALPVTVEVDQAVDEAVERSVTPHHDGPAVS